MTALTLNPMGQLPAEKNNLDPAKRKEQLRRWAARAAIGLMVIVALAMLLIPEAAHAGSDSTFRAIVDWLVGILKGSGGLMIAVIALIVAVMASCSCSRNACSFMSASTSKRPCLRRQAQA